MLIYHTVIIDILFSFLTWGSAVFSLPHLNVWMFFVFFLFLLNKTSYSRHDFQLNFTVFRHGWTINLELEGLIFRSVSCDPTAFPLANKSFYSAVILAYSFINISYRLLSIVGSLPDTDHWSLKGGHSLPTFLFMTPHPRWHLGVPTTHMGCLNPASGDKQSPVLATEYVQRSAGRKGSAAGRCECYRPWAETSR